MNGSRQHRQVAFAVEYGGGGMFWFVPAVIITLQIRKTRTAWVITVRISFVTNQ
jgi:hypothetical protein